MSLNVVCECKRCRDFFPLFKKRKNGVIVRVFAFFPIREEEAEERTMITPFLWSERRGVTSRCRLRFGGGVFSILFARFCGQKNQFSLVLLPFLPTKNHQDSSGIVGGLSRFIICGGKLFRGDFVKFNSIGFGNVNGGGVWCGRNGC